MCMRLLAQRLRAAHICARAEAKMSSEIDYSVGCGASTVVAAPAKALESWSGGNSEHGAHGYRRILARRGSGSEGWIRAG